MSGRVVHFEIPFDDGDRARAFYAAAFGWQVQVVPDMQYTIVLTGPSGDGGPTEPGFVNGGMLARDAAASNGPVLVVEVPSIDEALDTVGRLGGSTVSGRTPVGDMGFAAYVSDPEGNVVGLWQSAGG